MPADPVATGSPGPDSPGPRRRAWRRAAARGAALVGMVLAAWLAAVVAIGWGQEGLIFRPSPLAADHVFRFGGDVHEVAIDVPGARLSALHLRLPAPDGLVFYLHGNAGNLDSWFTQADLYRRANFDLFMIDYRGYGKSSGRIDSEAQFLADVRLAWDAVAPAYAGKRRAVVGRSLGSGLAAALAADVQPDATVLISPFRSLDALAREHYPWVPPALLRYPLRTDERLPRVRGDVWLVHGEADTLIAPSHARALQALRPGTRLVIVPGAGHNDLQRFPGYLAAYVAALQGIGAGATVK